MSAEALRSRAAEVWLACAFLSGAFRAERPRCHATDRVDGLLPQSHSHKLDVGA